MVLDVDEIQAKENINNLIKSNTFLARTNLWVHNRLIVVCFNTLRSLSLLNLHSCAFTQISRILTCILCFANWDLTAKSLSWGSRDSTVVRALASHQCGPGSIPGLGVIWLSLLLVPILAPRGFSPGTLFLPSPKNPKLLNSNLIWKVSPN